MGNRHPSITPYETLRAADGPLAVAVGNDAQFARLCAALGLGTEGYERNADRVRQRAVLLAALEEVTATRTVADWVTTLTAAGVPCGAVQTVAEGFALAERLGLDPIVETDGVRSVASPIRLSATPVRYLLPPPALDNAT
jgi:crotonobetainyl-CoA:carnitine CoA-transferase CaiB-like acyl-CoA transferase